ncbi:hypothetical protein [Sinorhizobium chiapasense]|uniref:Tetratricopeptide repeat protein n=1 Tax=Sinorhizobium chiapasense TaxID=501572 RepID=A0ABZ2BDE7_9HYPH
MLTYAGRSEQAVQIGEMALKLNPNTPDWYLWNVAAAYYFLADYETSLGYLQRMVQPGPAYRLIAATYARLGRREEASKAASELLKINPEFSISRFEAQAPYLRQDDHDHYMTGLRMAGLPE